MQILTATADTDGTCVIDWRPGRRCVITGYTVQGDGIVSATDWAGEMSINAAVVDSQTGFTGITSSTGDAYRLDAGDWAQWRFTGLTAGARVELRVVA